MEAQRNQGDVVGFNAEVHTTGVNGGVRAEYEAGETIHGALAEGGWPELLPPHGGFDPHARGDGGPPVAGQCPAVFASAPSGTDRFFRFGGGRG